MSECMQCPTEYHEQDFDGKPLGVSELDSNQLIDLSKSCAVCRAPISPRGDFGYQDFTVQSDEDSDRDPEWVPLCWACWRPIAYAETDTVDPRTGERATDGLEAV